MGETLYDIDYSSGNFGLASLNYQGNYFCHEDCIAIDSYLQHNKALITAVNSQKHSEMQLSYAIKGKLEQLEKDVLRDTE